MVYGCNDTTTSNILQSYTFTWGKVGKVSCPRTHQWGLKHRPSKHRLTCSTTWATVCAFLCSFPVYWPTTYSAFHIHPFIHTFIHWWQRLPYTVPTAHQKQFGVQYLAQRHSNQQPSTMTMVMDQCINMLLKKLYIMPLKPFWHRYL